MPNLTYAPIPEWGHIAKAVINKQLSNFDGADEEFAISLKHC